jgi:hypothetical protein
VNNSFLERPKTQHRSHFKKGNPQAFEPESAQSSAIPAAKPFSEKFKIRREKGDKIAKFQDVFSTLIDFSVKRVLKSFSSRNILSESEKFLQFK